MATSAPVHPASAIQRDLMRSAQARRGLAIFFTVVLPLSALFEALIVRTGDVAWYFPLMWTPALASLVARLALREGGADVSFRSGGWRGWRAMLLALTFPSIVGLIAYGSAWALGLAQFVEPTGAMAELARRLAGGAASSPLVVFMATLFVASTYGTLFGAITAAGEEIGWRGYMLTRLVDAGVPRPLLVSGVVWALWHVPLILAGSYAAGPSLFLSAASFVIGVTAVGCIIGRLRLETGSIWPAIILHAAWNSIIQGGFDLATQGASAKLWTGESGLLVMLSLVVAAFLLARRPWATLRQPARRTRERGAAAAEGDMPA
jgi:membrane protease YdiL (CAAX protease family)